MISFVGAGPGAPDLITLRGAARLAVARVVVWASSLVPEALLDHAASGAVIHDSSAMTLEDVLAVFAEHAGDPVVRLHSGDPGLYGALAEQIAWCVGEGVPFEVVPGVSSLAAAAAALPAELTVPGLSQSVVCTRLAGRTTESVPGTESVRALAAHGVTMAVFLSAARPAELQRELLAPGSGYSPATPAAVVARAIRPDQVVVRTTVGGLAGALATTGTRTTVLVLVGEALAPPARGKARRSMLYSPGFAHQHRRRSLPGTTTGRPAPGVQARDRG